MAHRTLTIVEARADVSNRIGYALAVVLGAVVSGLLGWWAVLVLGVFYCLGAWGAYRRWKALTS